MKLQFIEAGEIVTTHGIKGEVKVLPWLDSPEDLCDFDRCFIMRMRSVPGISYYCHYPPRLHLYTAALRGY